MSSGIYGVFLVVLEMFGEQVICALGYFVRSGIEEVYLVVYFYDVHKLNYMVRWFKVVCFLEVVDMISNLVWTHKNIMHIS